MCLRFLGNFFFNYVYSILLYFLNFPALKNISENSISPLNIWGSIHVYHYIIRLQIESNSRKVINYQQVTLGRPKFKKKPILEIKYSLKSFEIFVNRPIRYPHKVSITEGQSSWIKKQLPRMRPNTEKRQLNRQSNKKPTIKKRKLILWKRGFAYSVVCRNVALVTPSLQFSFVNIVKQSSKADEPELFEKSVCLACLIKKNIYPPSATYKTLWNRTYTFRANK